MQASSSAKMLKPLTGKRPPSGNPWDNGVGAGAMQASGQSFYSEKVAQMNEE